MRFDRYDYALSVARDRAALIDALNQLASVNAHVIDRIISTDKIFAFLNKNGKLYFFVDEMTTDEGKSRAFFRIKYHPKNAQTFREHGDTVESSQVVAYLQQWIALVSEYDNMPDENVDANFTKLQEEVEAEWFEPGEDVNETDFYDFQRQRMLYAMLERLRLPLSQIDEAEAKDILKDVEELQKDLAKLPQRPTVNRLRNIYAKVRKWGVNRAEELYDVAKKEVYKAILNGTIDDKIRGLIDIF